MIDHYKAVVYVTLFIFFTDFVISLVPVRNSNIEKSLPGKATESLTAVVCTCSEKNDHLTGNRRKLLNPHPE